MAKLDAVAMQAGHCISLFIWEVIVIQSTFTKTWRLERRGFLKRLLLKQKD
jgi:hypothetical protein